MTLVIEPKYRYVPAWPSTGLGYPLTSAVVRVVGERDDQATTGRDEDRAR